MLPAAELYADDGIVLLTKRPDEILSGWSCRRWRRAGKSYLKLRRRGAFDFPVLGVAVAVRRDGAAADAVVKEARVVLGAVDCGRCWSARLGRRWSGSR